MERPVPYLQPLFKVKERKRLTLDRTAGSTGQQLVTGKLLSE